MGMKMGMRTVSTPAHPHPSRVVGRPSGGGTGCRQIRVWLLLLRSLMLFQKHHLYDYLSVHLQRKSQHQRQAAFVPGVRRLHRRDLAGADRRLLVELLPPAPAAEILVDFSREGTVSVLVEL